MTETVKRAIVLELVETDYEGERDRNSGWTVRDGERYIDGLTWDEMLGQVATLTHPRLKGESLFGGMMTPEEHAKRREYYINRRGKDRAERNAEVLERFAVIAGACSGLVGEHHRWGIAMKEDGSTPVLRCSECKTEADL